MTADAAATTWADLLRALRAGDAEAGAALASDESPEVAARLADVARNAGALGLVDLRLAAASNTAPGRYVATLVWRVPGIDPDPVPTRLVATLTPGPDGARITSLDVDGQAPLWLLGPVRVHRSGGILVVTSAEGPAVAADPVRLAGAVARAGRTVRRVLPDWRPRLAVEVPGQPAAYAAALGVRVGERSAEAAVTTTLGDPATSRTTRVVLNPDVFGTLGQVGTRVVLAHEATHVATGAAASGGALWLLEGFADYVALRDVAVPERDSAAQLVALVRRDASPLWLPGERWFAGSGDRLAAAYQAAWLACRVLAERGGERALVRFYRAATHAPTAAILRQRYGLTSRELAALVASRATGLAG